MAPQNINIDEWACLTGRVATPLVLELTRPHIRNRFLRFVNLGRVQAVRAPPKGASEMRAYLDANYPVMNAISN